MRFARNVFIAAGVWGIVVLTPLYFLIDITGRQYTPPTDYPHFFYGFLAITMAWQIAFLAIGSDPARFRLLPSIFEKASYVVTLLLLYGRARISSADVMAAIPDSVLGVLFAIAFAKTAVRSNDDRAGTAEPGLRHR
jgi:hypothetical protein